MSGLGAPAYFARTGTTEPGFLSQKTYLEFLHRTFFQETFGAETRLRLVDSHGAYSRYLKDEDVIVLDAHFLDYLRMVTAALLTDDVTALSAAADACTADYFICKDELALAEEYAGNFHFKRNALESALSETRETARSLSLRQLLFVLGHEQGHALLHCEAEARRFQPLRAYFLSELEELNAYTKQIHGIDLSPIQEELDAFSRTKYDGVFDPEKNLSDAMRLAEIIRLGLSRIDLPEDSDTAPEELLYYACDSYLKDGGNQAILSAAVYEGDCMADAFALQYLFSLSGEEESLAESMKASVFAYLSTLLTMNLITCVNACVMNREKEGYQAEDYVWNRLRLEREILNQLIRQRAFRQIGGIWIAQEVVQYAAELLDRYTLLYSAFCEQLYFVHRPDDTTEYVPCGSEEFRRRYAEVQRLLSIDLKL